MCKMKSCAFHCMCILMWLLPLFSINQAYKNIRLQDYLCSDKLILTLQRPFRGEPTVTLTEDRESAAIITQTWNTSIPSVFKSNKVKYDCQFRVQTPDRPPRGIYTVITLLKFRHDPETNACLDYIQFSGGSRSPSERICNDISIDGPAGRLIFDQRDREVNVHIHVDKRYMIHESLQLRMVMTSHSECKYTGDFLCDPNQKYSCISRHFVRDNITNCMFPCRDEVSCFHDAIMTEELDAANVALSAITSLLFTMLGVGFCVWVCWKYWNCLTVQQRAHEASTATINDRTIIQDFPAVDIASAPHLDPDLMANLEYENAPQYPQQQQQPQLMQTPKDLPPSYESLFPDR